MVNYRNNFLNIIFTNYKNHTMVPKKLKDWDFVKNFKYNLSKLKRNEIPEQFYYQFDGHHYYPVCYVTDFNNIPEKIINHEETI